MPASSITLRPATEEDIPELTEVFISAFQDSLLNPHCYPDSDPTTPLTHRKLVERTLPDLLKAQDPSDPENPRRILGWVRWIRKETPSPHVQLTNDMYPPAGNQDLARRFFQANVDASLRILQDRPNWFLSLLVVRKDAQRRGVGGTMVRYGIERADEEGWLAYVNSSPEGKFLYEKHGFKMVEKTEFEHGIMTWHLKREPVKKEA